MQFQIFLIPFWAIYTLSTHIDKNNSDVIVTYTGHSEAKPNLREKGGKTHSDTEVQETKPIKLDRDSNTDIDERDKDRQSEPENTDVVFIPNEKEVVRNEDYKNVGISELIDQTNINGILKNVKIETESPPQDIIFISGKNNENLEKPTKDNPKPQKANKKVRLDCKNLDCSNNVESVCGGKEEEKKWKYRIFMNECYFRKVNCGFKYSSNRYKIMPMENCKHIGGRYASRPFVYQPAPPAVETKNDTRRSFSSRRSLNMGADGAFCSHACPDHCTDDYDPQCAVAATGQRRVFLNHCKLDYNSCLYRIVWHRRPLSECVGGKKADMRHNRGFIGWLQRVGIVDKRGRLVLS